MCGVEVSLKADVDTAQISEDILRVLPDKNDPFSKGSMCPKASALVPLHFDPEKLRQPVKRITKETGEIDWQEISWDEAYSTVIDSLKEVREKHGKDSIASYLGNPIVHNLGMLLFVKTLTRAIGSRNVFSATSMDQLPHHFAAHYMFGHEFRIPVPDVDRTNYMIIMGANPIASNGSMMTSAGISRRLKEIQERGGKFVVIDPRKTETANIASEHYFIKPSTDVYFLLSFLTIIFRDKKVKIDKLKDHINGFGELEKIVNDFADQFSPENVSLITGLSADTIERLASEYLSHDKAVLYGRMGLSTQLHGGLCHWLINTINLVSGHLDTEGGMMFPKPAIDLARDKVQKNVFGRWKSRVRGLKEFAGEFPVSAMTDELLTEGEGQVKAFVTICGNPVLSSPGGNRLDKALENMEFMVSIDNYINETTRHADIILPTPSGLEIDHYDLIFNIISVSNNVKFSEALFPPDESRPYDWQVLKTLTQGLAPNGLGLFDRLATPRRVINWGLMLGPYGKLSSPKRWFNGLSLKKLIESKHGINLGALIPQVPVSLKTPDKKVHIAPEVFVQRLAEIRESVFPELLNAALDEKTKKETSNQSFTLIGRRHVSTNNSWMHQVKKLSRSKQVRCTAMMHPDDAESLALGEGDIVAVSSRTGSIELPLEITNVMMKSVISIPHGFGHNKKDTRISNAESKPGVSLNDITDYLRVDELTGNAAFSGLAVSIKKIMDNSINLANENVVTSGKPLLVLYGSQSGNAEILATEVVSAAGEHDLLAKAVSMDKIDVDLLKHAERLLIIVSTFGEGEMPHAAEDLWESITASKMSDLNQTYYAVLALGDSSYDDFCQSGKNWNKRLAELNAQAVQDVVLCDTDYEEIAEKWQNQILPNLGTLGDQTIMSLEEVSSVMPVFSLTDDASGKYNRRNPMQAVLKNKVLLNKEGSSKQTYHYEFTLEDTEQSYNTGDIFYVLPKNNIRLIEQLLSHCRLKQDEKLIGKLTTEYEIRTPSKKLLTLIAEHYPESVISQLLKDNDLSNASMYGKDVLELLTEYPVVNSEESLLSVLATLAPRAYSIASSIQKHRGEVHLTVARVEYTRKDRQYFGTSSTYLSDRLEQGSEVNCYFSANKYFGVPDDNNAPIILVGPGTGIAPFRGFLEEREFRKATGKNWLFFGDRESQYDYLYEDELLNFQKDGLITRLDTAFSRDQKEKIYVQDRMLGQAKTLFKWLEKGAYIFVCGDAERMAKDVDTTLHTIVKEQGNMKSDAEAASYVQALVKEKRYVRDVY